jgi:hypothetical protein
MAPTNLPEDEGSRMRRLERELKALRDRVGLSSATIRQGGLTLLDDAFLRVVDDNGVEIVYLGPDSQGRQIIRIRREGGSDVMWTGFTLAGNQFWRLTDRFNNRELFSDDTESGGIARPWLPVPMYALYSMAASSTYGYMNIAAGSIASETVLWEGRIPLVSHPRLSVSGIWGQASGSNSATYKLKLNGTQVGTWSTGALENSEKGPFNIASYLDQTNVVAQLTVQASGTGQVGAQVFGCWLRQTP